MHKLRRPFSQFEAIVHTLLFCQERVSACSLEDKRLSGGFLKMWGASFGQRKSASGVWLLTPTAIYSSLPAELLQCELKLMKPDMRTAGRQRPQAELPHPCGIFSSAGRSVGPSERSTLQQRHSHQPAENLDHSVTRAFLAVVDSSRDSLRSLVNQRACIQGWPEERSLCCVAAPFCWKVWAACLRNGDGFSSEGAGRACVPLSRLLSGRVVRKVDDARTCAVGRAG